ncbi:hypothetical protein PBAL39_15469 [Pedobacter sp. BAL39]|uniref:hypothetical protein n=1 Tax=Pedobacter sp. BAL39 TaxID=391596 RepID=UPI0001559DBD|nr:hypothetical protein [Pedobacter sp. BAL39]EDM37837.1 hypothetical protein PBAL39_15469 [Pedobacter sp. BAL39]
MINRLIAITLLVALISANLSRFVVYAEFKANQQYIAAALCENRDKPEMHCDGKCYLMKKLKEAEDKEKKQEQASQKKGAQDVFIITSPMQISFVTFLSKKKRPVPHLFQLPEISSDILHPPPAGIFS